MRIRHWLAVLGAGLFADLAIAAPALEAYGQLPTLSNVTLSPNGQLIAFVTTVRENREVVILSIADNNPIGVLRFGEQKLRALQWADDSHLLLTTSVTTVPSGVRGSVGEFFMAQSYDLRAKSYRQLLKYVSGDITTLNVVTGAPQPRTIDGHTYLFVRGTFFLRGLSRNALFRVDPDSNNAEIESSTGNAHAEDWVVDESGHIAAEVEYYESDQRWKLRLYHNGESTGQIDVGAPIVGPHVEGLTEDGSAIIVKRVTDDEAPVQEEISLLDGSVRPWRHSDLHLFDLIEDTRTGQVIGGRRITDKDDYIFLSPQADKLWRDMKATFADATNIELVSRSQDMSKIVILVFGQPYGNRYFFVDTTTRRVVPVGPAYSGIEQISPVKWIDYRAGDGRTIHAYLTLPMGREAKNLPLIVLPHGGPDSRDLPGFYWLSQALASRGYVVLQPQFRGSDGFGRELLWAGFGEFGKKMQTDLSDGVRALATQGVIDPKRVCIVGASYGGYAALAGATLESGVYRCAVSVAGVSDWRNMIRGSRQYGGMLDASGQRFWYRFLNITDYDDPNLDDISPVKHADRASVPILLIHGKDDTVVPHSQSDDMADALKRAGKQVEFVRLEGEDHWLSRSETRLRMLNATVKFLEANNPPN